MSKVKKNLGTCTEHGKACLCYLQGNRAGFMEGCEMTSKMWQESFDKALKKPSKKKKEEK